MTSQTHALYRFWDARSELLYIGITLNPTSRWAAHRRRPWWHEVASITIETHPNRPAVLAAETTAIRAERPRYNLAQQPKPTRTAAATTTARHSDDEQLTPTEIRQIERALANPNHWGRVL